MMLSFITALLFGSNWFDPGTEVKSRIRTSTTINCINERAYYSEWTNALNDAIERGNVGETESIVKYCVKDLKDLESPLFKITGYGIYYVYKGDITPRIYGDSSPNDLILNIFIANGVNVNARNELGQTPLHLSTHKWGHSITKILIQNGANVNARDFSGKTPLHAAAEVRRFGLPNTIKLLIENGADVNAKDESGEVALHKTCIFNKKVKLARAIIEYGNSTDFDVKNNDGDTPLNAAIKHHSSNIARLLIESGADVNETDENGNTLLHQMIGHLDRLYECEMIVKALIDRGLNVNAQNKDGDTPLHLTSRFWMEEATTLNEILVWGGANINIRNKNGTLPHYHFSSDELKLLTFFANLKEEGAKALNESEVDVNGIGECNKTLLTWAADFNQTAAVRILIENGAKVDNCTNDEHISAIEYAVDRANVDVLKLLIQNGANVNSTEWGSTLLHRAAHQDKKGYANVAKALIEHGVCLNCVDSLEETALHAAIAYNIEEIIAFLEEAVEKQAKNGSRHTTK